MIVGPNNVGKSNLVRAISLAFGEGADVFDLERDAPAMSLWARPSITLDLRVVSPIRGFEKTLLRHAEAAEKAVLSERKGSNQSTNASQGMVRLRVKYTKEGRSEYIVTRGAGDQRAPAELNDRFIEQLRSCVRFLLVKSGEDLTDFLRGRFSEVLGNVLEENAYEMLQDARSKRSSYVDDLEKSLFSTLQDQVLLELQELVPELSGIEIKPSVPEIEDTISGADFRLTDIASTDLEGKGTGIRGGLLVAMLKYVAEESRRSLILALEEPETFLHPAAQELVRDDLSELAGRSDVTLLVTSHSPFVIPRDSSARIFSLEKGDQGDTRLVATREGDQPRGEVLLGLLRTRVLAEVLEEIAETPVDASCSALLLVEGETDKTYLEVAARLADRSDLLDGLVIQASTGAEQAGIDAVVWRSRNVVPVLVLLDHDVHGRETKSRLQSLGFAKSDVITYGKAISEVGCEAEWLLSEKLMKRFFVKHGQTLMEGKRKVEGRWVYDVHSSGKALLGAFVASDAKADELEQFIPLLEYVTERAKKLAAS